MLLGLTEEQEALGAVLRELIAKVWPLERTVERSRAAAAIDDRELWQELAATGCPGIAVPVSEGGAGGTWLDVVTVALEIGWALAPEGLIESAVAASVLGDVLPNQTASDWLTRLADGSTRAVLVDAARSNIVPLDGEFRIHGVASTVAEAGAADALVVAAATHRGPVIAVLSARSASIRPVSAYDPTRRYHDVEFDVSLEDADLLAEGDAASMLRQRAKQRAWVATSAASVGASRRALALAADYARHREQFGRPIGSFQSIKHLLADTLVAVESAWSATLYAAWAVDGNPDDRTLAIHAAACLASQAFVKAAHNTLQVYGGLGFTQECPAHLFVKRARLSEALSGGTPFHRREIASLLKADDPPGW